MTSKLLPLLALVVSVCLFFLYISPTWTGSIAAAKDAIASDDAALAAATEFKAHESALAQAKSNIPEENMKRLDVFLPDSVNNVQLILDLNALAAQNGLTIGNIDVSKSDTSVGAAPSDTSLVGSASLTLSASGTYAQLKSFLKGVESSERLLDIRDITVSGSETGVYNYAMNMRLYWLR